MSKVERIENEIQGLAPEELAEFRDWFLAFDWAAWDRQLEQDIQAGKLNALADEALREHAAGLRLRRDRRGGSRSLARLLALDRARRLHTHG